VDTSSSLDSQFDVSPADGQVQHLRNEWFALARARALEQGGSACPEPGETVEKLGYGAEFFVAFPTACAKQACRRSSDDDGTASA